MERAMSVSVRLPILFDTLLVLQPRIRQVIERRVGPSAAADLVQDMFLRLQRIRFDMPSTADARCFLIRMALNAATDYARLEGRRAKLLAGLTKGIEQSSPSPEEQVMFEEQVNCLEAALSQLPPKCRAVLYMSRVEGMTHSEIADSLGVSKSLVEKYIARAVIRCRSELKRQAEPR
jgi:RNA polymerase sigma factor (sigma-70 family)